MKIRYLLFLAFFFAFHFSIAQHSIYTELKYLSDISLLPSYSSAEYTGQVSSYDTTGGNDDGFSGRYSMIRRNADSTLVLFDQRGAGVINRIWTPTPTDDTLDFYIDSEDKIQFSISYLDLFSGEVFPFVQPLCGNQLGGFYSYIPIPFAKNCKIVLRAKKTQFHQIQYKMYSSGTEVIPFTMHISDKERKLLDGITSTWTDKKNIKQFYSSPFQRMVKKLKLMPGKGNTILKLNQPGRILGIEINPSKAFESLSKDIDIKISWDDEKVPAVYCPVADFFGFAFGQKRMQSLILGADESKCYSYIPMPFDRSATIELIYRNFNDSKKIPLDITVTIYHTLQKRDPDHEGKLYTHWNSNLKAESGMPHVFLEHQGKGHYIGTILQSQGLLAGMTYFFEGDDSTVLDGKLRLHGTGSEDYFNGGWYAMMDRWDQAMSLPLHGALDYSLLFCRTGGYRIFLSDKLNFNKNIHHSIEHGPVRNEAPVNYTSLAFFYSNLQPTRVVTPTNDLTSVYIPDTLVLYPQLIETTNFGNISVNTYWKYGTGGESYRYSTDKDSWLRMSLKEVPVGKYIIVFDIQKENTGTDFSVWQRQSRISSWFSAYSDTETRDQNVNVGILNLGTDNKTITIRLKTENKMKSLLVHRIKLIRQYE